MSVVGGDSFQLCFEALHQFFLGGVFEFVVEVEGGVLLVVGSFGVGVVVGLRLQYLLLEHGGRHVVLAGLLQVLLPQSQVHVVHLVRGLAVV